MLQSMQKQVVTKVNELLLPYHIRCNIKFDIESKRVAGTAMKVINSYTLRFNPAILERNFEAFLQDTVPHECAHLVQFRNYPGQPEHGKVWRAICLSMGGSGEAQHTYNTEGIVEPNQPFKVVCQSCNKIFNVSSAIVTRLKNGWTYGCTCRSTQLALEDEIEK